MGISQDMDRYRKHVRDLAKKREGTPVFNGSTDHAAVIAENMFARANNEVCIFSGKVNARVYATNEVREQIGLFLADDTHKLRVIVEDYTESNLTDHPFFDNFLNNENVTVRGLPLDISDTINYHFLVMDTDCYRFEGDKTKHEAVAAFGEPKGAINLKSVFENLWVLSAENEIDPESRTIRRSN